MALAFAIIGGLFVYLATVQFSQTLSKKIENRLPRVVRLEGNRKLKHWWNSAINAPFPILAVKEAQIVKAWFHNTLHKDPSPTILKLTVSFFLTSVAFSAGWMIELFHVTDWFGIEARQAMNDPFTFIVVDGELEPVGTPTTKISLYLLIPSWLSAIVYCSLTWLMYKGIRMPARRYSCILATFFGIVVYQFISDDVAIFLEDGGISKEIWGMWMLHYLWSLIPVAVVLFLSLKTNRPLIYNLLFLLPVWMASLALNEGTAILPFKLLMELANYFNAYTLNLIFDLITFTVTIYFLTLIKSNNSIVNLLILFADVVVACLLAIILFGVYNLSINITGEIGIFSLVDSFDDFISEIELEAFYQPSELWKKADRQLSSFILTVILYSSTTLLPTLMYVSLILLAYTAKFSEFVMAKSSYWLLASPTPEVNRTPIYMLIYLILMVLSIAPAIIAATEAYGLMEELFGKLDAFSLNKPSDVVHS